MSTLKIPTAKIFEPLRGGAEKTDSGGSIVFRLFIWPSIP
jgi:hypothetical protein